MVLLAPSLSVGRGKRYPVYQRFISRAVDGSTSHGVGGRILPTRATNHVNDMTDNGNRARKTSGTQSR